MNSGYYELKIIYFECVPGTVHIVWWWPLPAPQCCWSGDTRIWWDSRWGQTQRAWTDHSALPRSLLDPNKTVSSSLLHRWVWCWRRLDDICRQLRYISCNKKLCKDCVTLATAEQIGVLTNIMDQFQFVSDNSSEFVLSRENISESWNGFQVYSTEKCWFREAQPLKKIELNICRQVHTVVFLFARKMVEHVLAKKV